jgi:3-methyladenine DNA glycosylase AlkD
MDYASLFADLENAANPERAKAMSAYMRDQFPFLGISTPLRRGITKKFLAAAAKNPDGADWRFVRVCWDKPQREYQYVAVNYIGAVKHALTPDDVPKIGEIAAEKSWWDTIDGLDRIAGDIAQRYPEVNDTLIEWSVSENIWLRRIAIDHQLTRKELTDAALLARIIENCLGTKEFFINKAIGWSLREYGKTNPQWVRDFIARRGERMAGLSVREASRYI